MFMVCWALPLMLLQMHSEMRGVVILVPLRRKQPRNVRLLLQGHIAHRQAAKLGLNPRSLALGA